MNPVRQLAGRAIVIDADNVDTDQIIPARFLKTTSREGLGRVLFYDWRFDSDGKPRPDCPLNAPDAMRAVVLVAGENFGCGSSREHAAWAIRDFGFQAVVARSFGDIFRQNALKNGLVPVTIPPTTHGWLVRRLASQPEAVLAIDVQAGTLTLPDGVRLPVPLDPFTRRCLVEGIDEIDWVLRHEATIVEYEASRSRL